MQRTSNRYMNANLVRALACCVLLMQFGCAKQDTSANPTEHGPSATPNEPAARDAAPGPLSETAPPAKDATEPDPTQRR
jgi:hypothetical protein